MPPVSITREEALFATGCRKLADALVARCPFASVDALVDTARSIWWGGDDCGVVVDVDGNDDGGRNGSSPLSNVVIGVPEWLEAIALHPHIGSTSDLERGFAREREELEQAAGPNANARTSALTTTTSTMPPLSPTAASASEQAGAGSASFETQADLARWNDLYERKFGHMFMLSASGKSGEEILDELKRR